MTVPRRPWLLLLLLAGLPACGTVHHWQEVTSAPMSQTAAYEAVDQIARTDGYLPGAECDRGLGIWQSRWRFRQLGLGRPGRFRLRAELLLDEGSAATGWTVRFLVEQQKVQDLEKSSSPQESDWSQDGQDGEREYLFGARLARRIAPAGAATRQ